MSATTSSTAQQELCGPLFEAASAAPTEEERHELLQQAEICIADFQAQYEGCIGDNQCDHILEDRELICGQILEAADNAPTEEERQQLMLEFEICVSDFDAIHQSCLGDVPDHPCDDQPGDVPPDNGDPQQR